MKFPLIPAIAIALVSTLPASEIYFGRTTPADVAARHQAQPPQASSDGQIILESVFGVALTSPASESGDIRIIGAAISPTTASPGGFDTYEQDALDDALLAIQGSGIDPARTPGAAEYRYGLGQNGQTALWNVQFEGVPDYDSNEQNFFREKLDEAIASARTAIRANPFRKGDGSGYAIIFQASYEATVPYTFAGNEWRAKADRDRIGITPELASPTDRMASLQTAADRFYQAADALLAVLNHPVESGWLLDPDAVIVGAGPAWADGDSWADLLYESYAEAITRYADARFEYFYTRYLAEYQPPGSGNTAMQALISDIENAAAEIDQLGLPLAALATRGVLNPDIDVHGPGARSNLLRRLADNVKERALFFSAGVNPASGGYSNATYGANYVPFLVPAQLASRPFTFDNLLAFIYGIGTDVPVEPGGSLAGSLIQQATAAETSAFTSIDQVIADATELNQLRDDTRFNYEGQLKQLCGQRRSDPADPGSELIPDVIGYFAPTEFRDPLGSGEAYGDIALAWNKIEQAETRLLSAIRALAEIDEEAAIIRQYGDERLTSYDRIARIQLDTGEEISALDYLSGEIRAQAIKAEAEERAKQAEKKSWFSGVAKLVTRAAAAFVTGGGSELIFGSLEGAAWAVAAADASAAGGSELISGGLGLWQNSRDADSKAAMHRKIGEIQANAARRQAAIDAQRTQIRAMEGAQITMEQATQEDARIREAIHKLMIRVERQKLEILLAEQAVDFAEIEHSNLIARIGNLLEEYHRVSIRQAGSTLNRPDVRLVRDFEISEANRKFRVAQEYAYLLAKAAEYRFAGRKTSNFGDRIEDELVNILAAQNATQIEAAVEELVRIRGDFLQITNGLAPLRQVRYSLRDIVAQSNHWISSTSFIRDDKGDWTEFLQDTDLQPFPSTLVPSGTVADMSDAQFVRFLETRLVSDDGEFDTNGSSTLRINFPIGFEPSWQDRLNPLRERTTGQYGHVIEGPGPSYAAAGAVGVFVNIRNNRSFSPDGIMPDRASLLPVGASYVTKEKYLQSTGAINENDLQVWNLVDLDGAVELNNSIQVLYNKDTRSSGSWASNLSSELLLGTVGSQLHERPVANDHWVLEVTASDSLWQIFLPNMRDVEICMTIRGWDN